MVSGGSVGRSLAGSFYLVIQESCFLQSVLILCDFSRPPLCFRDVGNTGILLSLSDTSLAVINKGVHFVLRVVHLSLEMYNFPPLADMFMFKFLFCFCFAPVQLTFSLLLMLCIYSVPHG